FARNDLFTAEQQYDSSLDAFKIRLGMPTRQPLIIAPSEVIVPEPSLDSVAAVVTAFEFRLDLQTTADQVDDARRQVKIARNELLPDLDLFADVTVPTDPAKDEGGVDFSLGDGSYTAVFTFGSPIERTVERARHRESLINFERAQRSYTLQRDRVAQEVRNTVRGIQQARFSLQLQNRNVKLAERSRLGLKLQERRAPIRDVINAEDDLLDAKDRQDEAVRNLRVSILRYLLTTGQMRVSSAGQWLAPARLVPLSEPSPDGLDEPGGSRDPDPLTDRSGHVNIDPRWVQPVRIVRPMMTP
ncbi:MAG: TolC family protein, partial [Phycisphaeraceae bacterium]